MKKKTFIKYIYILYLFMFTFINKVNAAKISCSSLGDFRTDLQNIFNFAKILIPILVIGLTIFDFVKAVSSSNDKEIKTAFQRLLKRIIYAVVFMFLPLLLNFILGILGDSTVCIN